jgi:hypothetical protein
MMNARIGSRIAAAAWLVAVALPGAAPTPAQAPPADEVATPPRMEVEKDVIDLGDVVRGEEAVASFAVRNDGGETLRILKAKPG